VREKAVMDPVEPIHVVKMVLMEKASMQIRREVLLISIGEGSWFSWL
jgi:hypothetical protein